MSVQHSSLDVYSPFERVFMGLVLVSAGGLAYAVLPRVLVPLSGFLLIAGVMIFLQSSRGFQAQNDLRFVILLGIACVLVLVVDWWPLQLVFGKIAANALALFGMSPLLVLVPHFAGLQVLLFVPGAGAGALVGGEIDNACAGLPVLVPALLLLEWGRPARLPLTDRSRISLFTVYLVLLGDLARIVVELWLPGVGLASFDLVHYPGAFVLGVAGLIVIALVGNRWRTISIQ